MRLDRTQIAPAQGHTMPVGEAEDLDCHLAAIVHPVAEGGGGKPAIGCFSGDVHLFRQVLRRRLQRVFILPVEVQGRVGEGPAFLAVPVLVAPEQIGPDGGVVHRLPLRRCIDPAPLQPAARVHRCAFVPWNAASSQAQNARSSPCRVSSIRRSSRRYSGSAPSVCRGWSGGVHRLRSGSFRPVHQLPDHLWST